MRELGTSSSPSSPTCSARSGGAPACVDASTCRGAHEAVWRRRARRARPTRTCAKALGACPSSATAPRDACRVGAHRRFRRRDASIPRGRRVALPHRRIGARAPIPPLRARRLACAASARCPCPWSTGPRVGRQLDGHAATPQRSRSRRSKATALRAKLAPRAPPPLLERAARRSTRASLGVVLPARATAAPTPPRRRRRAAASSSSEPPPTLLCGAAEPPPDSSSTAGAAPPPRQGRGRRSARRARGAARAVARRPPPRWPRLSATYGRGALQARRLLLVVDAAELAERLRARRGGDAEREARQRRNAPHRARGDSGAARAARRRRRARRRRTSRDELRRGWGVLR